jgi:predicted acetyltransferase
MSDSVHLVHRATSGLLPTSTFNMVDEGGAVIGFAQVRHRASHSASLPPEAANHVYLQIAEPYRGQGHGKRLLALALIEARRISLQHVRLTVKNDNPRSRHIIEGAGGLLVGEFTSRAGELYRLFVIRL